MLTNAFHACFSRAPQLSLSMSHPLPSASSFEHLLMQLVGNPSVHQRRDVVDLLVLAALQKLAVTVCVFERNGIAHSEGHELLVEHKKLLCCQLLQFSERDRL